MIVHLVDGTYELFRHFYGLRRFSKGQDPPFGGVIGVLQTLLQMIEQGATHLGVATDHAIESFRNGLWPSGSKPDRGAGAFVVRARLGRLAYCRGRQDWSKLARPAARRPLPAQFPSVPAFPKEPT